MPSFGPFTVATYHLLMSLADVLGGAAVAIVVLTVCLRLALLPLTLRQIAGERARAALAPRLAELTARHGSDPAAYQRAVLDLHKEEGVPMLAGCLPALAQAPFFAVLYSVFIQSTIDGRPNALLAADLFGTSLGASGTAALPVLLGVLALMAVVATVSARRIRRTIQPGQPGFLSALPYLSVVFAAFVPLAAGVYLLTTTAWSALETAVLRRPR